MGSVRSNNRKEKEVNKDTFFFLDEDSISFLVSLSIHVIILLIMACIYETQSKNNIKLVMSFSSDVISEVELDIPESADINSLVTEIQSSTGEQKDTLDESIPDQSSAVDIEQSLTDISISDLEEKQIDTYDTKDLLSAIKTNGLQDNISETVESQQQQSNNSNTQKILGSLSESIGAGVGFNRTQPNPFGSTGSSGSSLEARLKAAGAKTGEIQISISWDTVDDIDLHVSYSPGNGLVDTINWINRIGHISGGMLDIDMNANHNMLNPRPVENVFWPKNANLTGHYMINIHFYRSWTGNTRVPVIVRLKIRDKIQTFNINAVLHSSPQRVTNFEY